MPIPIFFVLFIIIIVYFSYKTRIVSREEDRKRKEFWELETKANFTRKKDISQLNYITIDLNALPIDKNTTDPLINEYQDKVIALSQEKILNLNPMTNTQLKLTYGSANLDLLTSYENNYTSLIRTLYIWANYLVKLNKTEDAIKVLEYGLLLNTDISEHFILLGKLYKENNNTIKFEKLINKAEELDSLLKNKIINNLKKL